MALKINVMPQRLTHSRTWYAYHGWKFNFQVYTSPVAAAHSIIGEAVIGASVFFVNGRDFQYVAVVDTPTWNGNWK